MFRKKFYTLIAATIISALAATTAQADVTVYVSSSNSSYYMYAYSASVAIDGSWPGTQFSTLSTTTVNGMSYYYKTYENYSSISIVFNEGNGGSQTLDITGVTDGTYFTYNGGTSYTSTDKGGYYVVLTGGDSTLGNNWANSSSTCVFDTSDGQNFTYTFTEGSPYTWSGSSFKIADYTGGTSEGYWYSYNNWTATLGTSQKIYTSNSNSNMPTLTSGNQYTITLTFESGEYAGSQHNEITFLIEEASTSEEEKEVSSVAYYVYGHNSTNSSESWSNLAELTDDDSDGTYTAYFDTFVGQFLIAKETTYSDNSTKTTHYRYGSSNDYYGLTVGTSYELSTDGEHNLVVGSNEDTVSHSGVTFSLTVSDGTLTLLITEETETTVMLKGDYYSTDDWTTTGENFTQSEDEENTWTISVSSWYGQFKIYINDNWYGYGTSTDYWGLAVSELESGVTLSDSGANMLIHDPNGNSDTSYVWSAVTFTVKYSDGNYILYADCNSSWQAGQSSGYYLVGECNDWSFNSSYEFTKSSTENQYTLTINNFCTADSDGNLEFEIGTNDWSTLYLVATSVEIATSESEATTYSLSTGSSSNNGSFSEAKTWATVTFVLTNSNGTWTLKAYGTESYELSDSEYDYYIVGDWNEIDGEWLPNPLGKLTGSDGSFSATISDFYGYFKVMAVPTGRYDAEEAIYLTSNSSHNIALSTATSVAANYSNDNSANNNNMSVVSSSTVYSSLTFTFDTTGDIATLTVVQNSTSTDDDTSGTDTNYYLVTSFNDYSYKVSSEKDTTTDDSSSSTSTSSITYSISFASEDAYNAIGGNAVTEGTTQGISAYAWYYTEDGTKVEPLNAWPGTNLGFESYSDTKTVTLPTTTSLNFIVNNGYYEGTGSGAIQTKDIVPGAYYGTYSISIGSDLSTYIGAAQYISYTNNTTANSTINFYIVPDETLGNTATTAPTLHIYDTSNSVLTGSWDNNTASCTIDSVAGKYMWKYSVSTTTPLGLVMRYESNQTVDITGIVADVYLNYLNGEGEVKSDNYKTIALNMELTSDDESSDDSSIDYSGWKFQTIKLNGSSVSSDVYFDAVIVALSDEATTDDWTSLAVDGSVTMLEGYEEDFKTLAEDQSGNFYVQQGNTGNRYGHSSAVIYGSTEATDYSEDYGWYEYAKGTYLTQLTSAWNEEDSSADYMLFLIGMKSSSDVVTTSAGGHYVAVVLVTDEQVETGIEKVDADGNVIIEETYYTVKGLQVQNPEDREFYIVVRKYADGTTQAFKEAICK